MSIENIIGDHSDLLTRPLFGHLAMSRSDGSLQANPMWYQWTGDSILFTTTTDRRKYSNVREFPTVALSINDPDQPYRYLELRGEISATRPDTSGTFFLELAHRYGMVLDGPPPDVARRVVLVMTPTAASKQ